MAYLGEIVDTINEALKAKLTAFPLTGYNGLAYPIPRKKGTAFEYLPAKISVSGEAKWITFDDVRELEIYHRIVSSSYIQLKGKSYGDGDTQFQHNYEIDLIVMADRKKAKVEPDVLEAAIASNIPVSSSISGVSFINITPVSANHNSRSLFSQEFQGIDYFLKPEHILFSIRYRVELQYQKGCLNLCQCD
jgi:hypothetical protein